jgi:predicted AlkP superfamily pyrophosphatase or phosphodiesterase
MKNIESKISHLLLALLFLQALQAQNKSQDSDRPKLMIGLVVDQMRWDFLYRYPEKYGKDGFNRILSNGFSCEQTYIHHSPTITAPGHASIFTGSVPGIHGIAGNNWYDCQSKKDVYCVYDSTVQTIGSATKAGWMSPRNLKTTTICDELRLATNFKSKTIGIALKDRGAILPAGHTANAAFWFDGGTGKWVSSSYYMTDLPPWVHQYNEEKNAIRYVENNWNTLLPISQYHESHEDDAEFEATLTGEQKPVFIHQLNETAKTNYGIIRYTPFGNTLTFDLAQRAIQQEKLGKGNHTDFITISLSSPDYIGHQFGPNSIEIEDNYIRLDKDIAAFLTFLDKEIGKDNYLLFLTADHGAAHVPAFMNRNKLPAGIVAIDSLIAGVNTFIKNEMGITQAVITEANHQLYLNKDNIPTASKEIIKKKIQQWLENKAGISRVIDLDNMDNHLLPQLFREKIVNGWYPGRSGDMFIMYEPGWFDGFNKGTTHSVLYPYDTHIPLLFYGKGIRKGKSFREIHMADIAPTVAALLNIQTPNGTIGKVITEIFKNKR